MNYVVVTPVRDEAAHVARTLASVDAQTLRPLRWVIVDDGSTDGTGAIVDAWARDRPWISVVHRGDRGFRAAGGGVVQAVQAGLAAIGAETRWDCLVKLDADLDFGPDYFAACLRHFDADPRLGIGGGTVCVERDGRQQVESTGDPRFHVRGATKIYRRACWDAIAPLVEAPGWDTFDEVKANQLGWRTATFADVRLLQTKPTGAAAGRWRDAAKNGRANYVVGYDPLFMLAKCARRALRPPLLLHATALLWGFCSGYLKRVPQVPDAAAIRWLRGQQRRRLLLRPSVYDHRS